MENVKAIVDRFINEYGSSDAWVSERMGMSRQALNNWWNKDRSGLPAAYQLKALSVATRTPYQEVLDAALTDFDYLPEPDLEDLEIPARMQRKDSAASRAANKQRKQQASVGEESQDIEGFDPA